MANQKGKPKQKIKVKKLVPPIVASVFFLAVILTISLGGTSSYLMGNSVTSNYICPDGYKLANNSCKLEINATKMGDVNGDNLIDNLDIVMIEEHLNGNIALVSEKFKAADINGDGRISTEDIDLINSHINSSTNFKGYVCPDDYILDNNKCYITKEAISVSKKSFEVGDAILYNNSYWYVLSDNEDYVTLLKKDSLNASELGSYAIDNGGEYQKIMYYKDSSCLSSNTCNDYNSSNIKIVLDNYASSFSEDLKEVNGYKIRLITIDELVKLGFADKTNTLYYEESDNTPYWIGSNGGDYWVMNSSINNTNNTFTVVDYNNKSYVYESTVYNKLAMVRPVINLYKNKI